MRPFTPSVAAVAAAAALTAVPSLAQAAPAWSPAANVSASANDIGVADIAVDQQGRALATWAAYRWESGTPRGHYVLEGFRTATRAPGVAAFAAPRSAPGFVVLPVLYAQTRAVALDQRDIRWERCGQRRTLRARFGTSDGTFGSARTIETSTDPGGNGRAGLAANGSGQVLAAWAASTRSDCSRSAIRIAVRRPGGSGFGEPTTLRGSGRAEQPSVAVGQGGDMLAAWHRRIGEGKTAVEARFRAAGHSWGSVVRLGTSTVSAKIDTVVAQNGRAYVAWGAQTYAEGEIDARVMAAVRPAGAGGFRAAQTLERIQASLTFFPERLGPSLALAGTRAYVAWSGRDSRWRVRVSGTDGSGRFTTPQTVSGAGVDALLGDLAALPDGTATVLWSDLDDEGLPRDVLAAFAPPPARTFGAPELVNPGALRLPAVAIDPVTRQPTAVWAQRLGPGTSVSTITAYVRASTRSGG